MMSEKHNPAIQRLTDPLYNKLRFSKRPNNLLHQSIESAEYLKTYNQLWKQHTRCDIFGCDAYSALLYRNEEHMFEAFILLYL